MKTKLINSLTSAFIIVLLVATSNAQNNTNNVYWHIDPGVKSCSMVIDPSLTQSQWKTYVKQVGAISTFKSLASAEPLGTFNFNIGIVYSSTPVNQHDPAWINTFVHPDADCPLGDEIAIPTIRAEMGVSETMDIGAVWTHAPNANYGMIGGEVKYQFLKESEKLPAAAVRGSFSMLTGVSDYNLNTFSFDLIASKKFAMLTSYLGFRGSLAVGTETTSKVNLDKESILIPQGYAGISYSIWMLNLAAEYDVSYVNTFAVQVGFNF